MKITYQDKVGDLVAEDYRLAGIFEKYGIDFCCKGGITIEEACQRKNIMTEDVMRDLKIALSNQIPQETNYQSWTPIALVDYIINKHHQYVRETTPVILQNLDKLCHKHGQEHPELFEINKLFSTSAEELAMHMHKEEKILFPLIRKISAQTSQSPFFEKIPSSVVAQPISVMMEEHEAEGDRFSQIDMLTNHYQAPADACNTFKVTYGLLKEFEKDLHTHIHLENNILFTKVLQPEETSSCTLENNSCSINLHFNSEQKSIEIVSDSCEWKPSSCEIKPGNN